MSSGYFHVESIKDPWRNSFRMVRQKVYLRVIHGTDSDEQNEDEDEDKKRGKQIKCLAKWHEGSR